MKIQYASDLHLEFPSNVDYLKNNPLKPIGDILILAGDITYYSEEYLDHWIIDYLADNFKEVYMIQGNHEFYKNSDLSVQLKPFMEDIRPNFHVVNNLSVSIDGYKFIFSTLWSKISHLKEQFILRGLNDYRAIKMSGETLKIADTNNLHSKAVEFLKSELTYDSLKNIVVTHHLPSDILVASCYNGSLLNEAFTTNLDWLEDYPIDYWIYGHSHGNIRGKKIGSTEFLTNQLGYVQYENTHKTFKTDLILEL